MEASRRTAGVDGLLLPFDRVRTKLLLAARPWSSRLAADRDARVAWIGAAIVAAAFLGAVCVPLWMLALGPIVLGVPHLLADLRYVGWRSGLLTHRRTLIACGLPLAIMGFWGGLPLGFVAVAAAFALSSNGPKVRVGGMCAALVCMALALEFPVRITVIMAHAHNFIAVALWWAWRPRQKAHAWTLALLAACSFALMAGLFDGRMLETWGPASSELTLASHAALLTDGFALAPRSVWPGRWVLLFAFAQAVHYGVWLHLVRDDARARATPRTFVRSYRVARAEMGSPVMLIAMLLSVGLAIWAVADLVAARDGYFRFAQFHGSLELCGAALFMGARSRLRAQGSHA